MQSAKRACILHLSCRLYACFWAIGKICLSRDLLERGKTNGSLFLAAGTFIRTMYSSDIYTVASYSLRTLASIITFLNGLWWRCLGLRVYWHISYSKPTRDYSHHIRWSLFPGLSHDRLVTRQYSRWVVFLSEKQPKNPDQLLRRPVRGPRSWIFCRSKPHISRTVFCFFLKVGMLQINVSGCNHHKNL